MKKNLLLATLSLLAALTASEVGLRVTGKLAPPPYPPTPRLPEMYTAHPAYGYALWPSRTMRYEYPPEHPRTLTVVSNRDGFRNRREFDEADARPRVLVVGDSYTFGEGVEAEERFSNLLESREPGWRVDNMGMTGFGPDLMIMALESLLSKAEPDLVVLALAFDDFRRVRDRYAGMGFPSPRFELRGRRLTRVPFPAPKPWERSHLVHGLLMALEEAPVREPLDAGEWRINRAILDRFRELSREHRFQPVLVYLAGPWTGQLHRRRAAFVREYGEEHGIPTLDVSEAIHSADPDGVYLPKNSHYSAGGHAIVASELEPLLRDLLRQ